MKKGFTLVELLAVIVILAVILVIAVPKILSVIDNAKEESIKTSALMIIDSAQREYSTRDMLGTLDQVNDPIECSDLTNLSANDYGRCEIVFNSNLASVVLYGQGKYDGYMCSGTKDEVSCVNEYYNDTAGVNIPQLATGMTPIKWNGTSWVNTTADDPSWYSYDTTNKNWANAKTADGSMWVWIPRYIYKITSNWNSTTTGTIAIQFSKGLDDNWNKAVIGNISTNTTSNASNNTWTNHPAFTFGTKELTGIWVAKFEATAAEGIANSYNASYLCSNVGDDVSTKTVKIVPNVESWRCISVGNAFSAIRNMETSSVYGWPVSSDLQTNGSFLMDKNNLDTHLIKGVEWGAVVYLSKSVYGKNTVEIWGSNSKFYTTGCAGSSENAAIYDGCQYTYETAGGVKASTTGNISGVYGISGIIESTSAYINNANVSLTNNGLSIINASDKYKDIYLKDTVDGNGTNYALLINKKGDATYETSFYTGASGVKPWFADYAFTPNLATPWFQRSGTGADAGAFYFTNYSGVANINITYRPVLVVGSNL